MDGSGAAFLLEPPFQSALGGNVDCGILYVEDFDNETQVVATDQAICDKPAVAPCFTADDVEAARQLGFDEGTRAALADALLLQEQLRHAALQSLGEALSSARGSLERIARHHAETSARAVMAVLQAAIPATMARHATCELDAVVRALSPGLTCLPELRVRVHPDSADHVRDSLVECLPSDGVVLCVTAEPALAEGDLHLAWQDGGARRDCRAIWDTVRSALAPLGLPTFEELCRGC